MRIKRTLDSDGYIRYRNEKGKFHRENGPAIESPYGFKAWYRNGEWHREDGPALVYSDGRVSFYLNSKEYSKEEWETEILKLKLGRIKDL